MTGHQPWSAQGSQVTQIGARDVVSWDTFIPIALMLKNDSTRCQKSVHRMKASLAGAM